MREDDEIPSNMVRRPLLRTLLAVPVYLGVAVASFWPFGDHGVTLTAVLVAAAFNLAFGIVFGWRSLWVPILVFGGWSLSLESSGSCENCGVVLDAGVYSLLFAVIGAAARQITSLLRRRTAERTVRG